MDRKTNGRLTILLMALVVATLATTPLLAPVAASENPETADDYFETFRAMEGTDAYESYDEFETMRTFAVSQTQETGSLSSAERAELDAVLETLLEFERAYEYAAEGEYDDSLDAAEETASAIQMLENHEQTQAALANIALTRFYEGLGDGLHEQSEAAEQTPTEIAFLEMSVTAYEQADMPEEAAEFRVQLESRNAEYERDLARMSDAENGSAAFLESCTDCTEVAGAVGGNLFGAFEEYQHATETYAETRDAEDRAAVHGLEDEADAFAATGDEVATTRTTLAIASATILSGYGVVVGLIGTVVFGQLFRWRRTYDAAQVGSVVAIGENDV